MSLFTGPPPSFSSPAARRIWEAGERFQSVPTIEVEREAVVRGGVAEASADLVSNDPPRCIGVGRGAIKEACRLFGVTSAAILGSSRVAILVLARQWITIRLADEFGWTNCKIGHLLHKDPSTILNARRRRDKLDAWMATLSRGKGG
jgi:hypothetical protein